MLAQPDRAYIDDLGDQIALCAAHIDSAHHQLLTHIRSFDALKGWCKQGAKSCAHWLSWRIGLGMVAAREKVRVAHALASLPEIDAALERGELSYAKVRAMTRVADARVWQALNEARTQLAVGSDSADPRNRFRERGHDPFGQAKSRILAVV